MNNRRRSSNVVAIQICARIYSTLPIGDLIFSNLFSLSLWSYFNHLLL